MKKLILFLFFIITYNLLGAQLQQKVKTNTTVKTLSPSDVSVPTRMVAYDFKGVKICLDAFGVPNQPLPPLPVNNSPVIYKIDGNGNISRPGAGISRQGLVGFTDRMWAPGTAISVYLSNKASETLRNKVKMYAKEWEQYANIRFNFIDNYNAANIKVTFDQNGQSWSWLGRDVLLNAIFVNTMNLGWLKDESTNAEIRRVVLHEFGHALGLGHEHLSPASTLIFDKKLTYAYFQETNKWSPMDVDLNVINKYSTSNTIHGPYDPLSIMHYPIPSQLLIGTPQDEQSNYFLSEKDKEYARLWYPFPPSPTNAVGNLFTGDDCDNIYFTIEYNVVPADKIEFRLEFGQTDGNMVSWWKKIGIPLNNGRETVLEILNHSLIASENRPIAQLQIPASDINTSKGISFAKAKFLGVHTDLAYKWNVLPALTGGCRVRLTWRKDKCAP